MPVEDLNVVQQRSRDVRVTVAQTVSVSTSPTTVLETYLCRELERLHIVFFNADENLSSCTVDVKTMESCPWVTIYSDSIDYTSPAGLLLGASGALNRLPAGGTGWLSIDLKGFYAMRVQMSATSSTSNVSVYVGGV